MTTVQQNASKQKNESVTEHITMRKSALMLARLSAVTFGILWVWDGFFKFAMNLYTYMPAAIQAAGVGQPAYLNGWFSFWYHLIAWNPMLFTWMVGFMELALGVALILGFARKIAYFGGIILSLIIWTVPEGFGGPYGSGSLVLGAAHVYAIAFLVLIALNATFGSDIYTLDAYIGRKHNSWKRFAEIRPDGDASVNWFSRNSMKLSRFAAILFGIVFAGETYLVFVYNTPSTIVSAIKGAASGQPAYIGGWYSFWISQVTSAPAFYYYLIGAVEMLLAFSLLLGFARKAGYIGGMIYALMEWATLKAFGGPISAGYTDAGQVIVAIVFLIFLALNAAHGTDPYTLDARIERKFPIWRRIAEMKG
ncbi:MAG: hypothetical protein KIY11_00545 [Thermoplasmata archaeon]|nr:hypothetical protein [Candidatus Sysuiplasma acidicola]